MPGAVFAIVTPADIAPTRNTARPGAISAGITIAACSAVAYNTWTWRTTPLLSITCTAVTGARFRPNRVTISSGAKDSLPYDAALAAASGLTALDVLPRKLAVPPQNHPPPRAPPPT